MTKDSELRELLAPMAEHEVDLDASGFRVDRARVLARMAEAGRTERRSLAWFAVPVLAAAAALALVVGTRAWQARSLDGAVALEVLVTEGRATQSQGSSRALVSSSQSVHIAAAGELETAAASQAKVSMEDGLQIELRDRTRVGLGELRQGVSQLKLIGGAVRCTVPHRTAEHAFHVVTPNATVFDLGTIFTVRIDDATHVTHVSVEEGEVMVRSAAGETRVVAPNSWSSAPSTPGAEVAPPAASESAPTVAPDEAPRSATPRAPSSASKAARPSLAREAQLLRQGLTAERQGHPADAVVALKQLLDEYPNSPLAPDARAALTRVEAQPH